ncbi:MAG: hypothetical protein ACJ8EC_21885, partial [Microvirga sp.]
RRRPSAWRPSTFEPRDHVLAPAVDEKPHHPGAAYLKLPNRRDLTSEQQPLREALEDVFGVPTMVTMRLAGGHPGP